MADWTETYRGVVAPWECDITEHFTIAYYFDRLADAEALALRALGLSQPRDRATRLDLRFTRELRAGASFHILSGPLGLTAGGLRLAHRIVDSANGETVTWVEQELAMPSLPPRVAEDAVRWEGPAIERRPEPKTTDGFIPTARDRVKPADCEESGELSLAGFVHRFTAGCMQGCAAIGMSADYMNAERRGFSTFELQLAVTRAPRLGEAVRVDTGILHLGSSSVRFLHRMSYCDSGEELARLSQFGVQLDLDARRPAALPEEMRARAAALVVPVAG
jgi:acyl-CoA thioesterase FadM